MTEIGTVAAASYVSGDAYDYASILRTNTSANMSSQNFAGGTVDGDSGVPEIGEALAMCGCADGALFGTCSANSKTVTVKNDIIKTNVIEMNKDTTSGSSGGCLAYLDGATNKVNLTGLLLGSNGSASFYTKYGLVKSRFNLTTVY